MFRSKDGVSPIRFSRIKIVWIYLLFLFIIFCQFSSFGQASFTPSRTSGCVPLTVAFINTSGGDTAYSWNFGDGTPRVTSASASKSYAPAGVYTVTLTGFGGGDSTKSSMVITVYPSPTAGFFSDDTLVCPRTPVHFVNTSVGSYGPLTYLWTFGDGDTSVLGAPTYNYPLGGSYSISLVATNSMGCASTHAFRPNYVHVYTPPAPIFIATDTFFCKPLSYVSFVNSSTGTGSLSYYWNFDDDSSSTLENPTHQLFFRRSYDISLAVTDIHGCADTVVKPAYLRVGTLSAGFTFTPTICIDATDTFRNTSTPHLSSHWIFGDGDTSDDESPVHLYVTAGTFNVMLVVFDGVCHDTSTQTLTIADPPFGIITQNTNAPCPPAYSVTFTGVVPSGCTVSWLFGDGVTRTGLSTTRTNYVGVIDHVKMIVTNSVGCESLVDKIDTIYNFYANISPSPPGGCKPLNATLNVSLNSYQYLATIGHYIHFDPAYFVMLPYPYPVTSYSWNYGDGTSTLSTAASPSHIYTSVGTYNETCTFSTANGCTVHLEGTVFHDPPNAPVLVGTHSVSSFTVTPAHACANEVLTFTASVTGAFDAYNWIFGDGTDTLAFPVARHLYYRPDHYIVGLLTYDKGCITRTSMIDSVDSPGAEIIVDFNCHPRNIVSLTSSPFGATSQTWIFGDGSPPATDPSVTHYFTGLSNDTVTLATYNSRSGCRDTAVTVLELGAPPLTIFPTDSSICRDIRIDSVLSAYDGHPAASSYVWYLNGTAVDSLEASYIAPYHIRGVNNIILVVTDSHGCRDSAFTHILVAKPIDSFDVSTDLGCLPLTVHFADRSVDVAGATITQHYWDMGDGTASVTLGLTPTEVYTVRGTYDALEVTVDNIGCKDTFIYHRGIQVHKPVASFTMGDTIVCEGANNHFNNTSPGIASSFWMFGDGGTSIAMSPNHIYSVVGVYVIRLVVTDSFGCVSDTFMSGNIVVNPSPVSIFTMDDSFAVCPPLTVHFTNSSTGVSSSYEWYFTGTSSTGFSMAYDPTWYYDAPGLFTIQLVTKNTFGCYDTATEHTRIFGYAGAFNYTPIHGCAPVTVFFNGGFSDTSVTSVFWDFGDGVTFSSSLSDTISHTYGKGSFTPRLILADTPHCPTTYSIGLETIKSDTLTAAFTSLPNPVCQNAPLLLIDSSYSYFSPDSAWLWSYGNGATSTSGTPSYNYSVTGTYPVTMTVTNKDGCTKSVTNNVTVLEAPGPITGVVTVCNGTSSALSNSVSGGTWSSSGSGIVSVDPSSGLVTSLAAGTTIITYRISSGCAVTALFTVNKVPSAISGTPIMCIGFTSTLTDTTSGGRWSSSNTAIAKVGSTSGIVTGMSQGTVLITYAFGSGSACGITIPVTIDHSPSPILGSLTVCNGQNTTLSDTVAGGIWLSGNLGVVTVGSSTGIVTGVSVGSARITYTIGGSGCRVLSSITVLPLSPITGNVNVCAGLTTRLADATAGGNWHSSNSAIAPIGLFTGIISSPGATGTAIITYTLSTGCAATTTVMVNPEPGPVAGNTHICQGYTTNLSDIGGGTWSSSSPTISTGSSSGIITGISIGTGIVTYILSTGCTTTVPVNVTLFPAGITGTTTICAGATTHLLDTSPGGTWSSGNLAIATAGSGTGMITGVSAGTTLISYSFGGCSTVTTLSANPIPGPINGSNGLCLGFSVTLTDTTSGGTWTSGTTGVATIVSGTGVATGLAVGTSVISYTLSTGCLYSETVSVGHIPPAITGDSSTCYGLTTLLSDGTAGGSWSSDDTSVAAVGSVSGAVTGIAAGTARVSYTISGCAISTRVTVNPLPGPISGSFGCLGLSALLSDTSAGGTWISGSTGIAAIGASTGVMNGVAIGTVVITYKLLTGCITTMVETIKSVPSPVTGPTTVCMGYTINLSDASSGGIWISGSGGIASVGSGTGIVTGEVPGTAMISYVINGCPALRNIIVYPLPGPITGPDSMCEGGATIRVYDDTLRGAWTSTFVTVDTTGLVTSYGSGEGTVTYTLGTGCFLTKTITIKPWPGIIFGANYVCLDSTITLVDLTPGGTWSCAGGGAYLAVGSSTGRVTGVATGSAIVTYNGPNGCVSEKTIAVNPLPLPITGPGTLCAGSIDTLRDVTTGGFWSSGATGIAAVGSVSGIVSGISAGTATITYLVTNLCGPASVTKTILVNPLPIPGTVTGDSVVCVGATTQLYDTTGGPGTWSSSNAHVSVSTSGLVAGIHTGFSTITYTVTNICGTIAATRFLIIDTLAPISPITGSSILCAGGALTLGDVTPGGMWSSADSAATVSGGIVTGISAGNDIISYSISNYCGLASVIHTILVNPLPDPGRITGDTSVCFGLSIVLSETTTGGTWLSRDTDIAIISGSGGVTMKQPGVDTIEYSLTNLCGTTKAKFGLRVKPSPEHVHLSTYPDPALCNNTRYQNFGADSAAPPNVFYTWSAGSNAEIYTNAGGQYSLVSFTSPGVCVVKITASMAGTDCISADSVSYNVSSITPPEPGVVYYSPELVCTDNTATSYQWGYDDAATLDSTLFSGEINQNYYNPNLDLVNKYYWVITYHNGCLQKSYYNKPLKINFYSSGNNFKILLYPNPAENEINITIAGIGVTSGLEVKIYDELGNVVKSAEVKGAKTSIPLDGCASGVYMVMVIKDGEKIGSGAFIKN